MYVFFLFILIFPPFYTKYTVLIFDVTTYLSYYGKTQEELATMIIHDVYDTTGITATAGIGTNMFLCKIAMDVMAKKIEPDKRINKKNELTAEITGSQQISHNKCTSTNENYVIYVSVFARCIKCEWNIDITIT